MFNLRLLILDIAKGTRNHKYLNYYYKTKKWPREKVKSFQEQRLQEIVYHAYNTVPYYRRVFDNLNIKPEQIKTIDDLKKVPILDRDLIQKEKDNLISSKFNKENLISGSSSGTTGIPINYFFDKEGYSAGFGAGIFLWSLAGKVAGVKNFYIWGNESSIKRWNSTYSKIKNILVNQKNVASHLLNTPEGCVHIAKAIIDFKPKYIEGYPSSIYTLADYVKKNDLKLIGVKAVLSTAENLENHQRELIEDVFGPTADLYGSGEVLGMALRLQNQDKYYILDPHIIIETIDTEIEGMKEIVVTDLDNYGMPKIRYKIGDMIDNLYEPGKEDKIQFTYFKKIYGRSSDIIDLPSGKKFHPINIFGGTTLRQFEEIRRHKVVWDGHVLKIILEVNTENNKGRIIKVIEELLSGFDVESEVLFVDKIFPSKSGKFKYLEVIK
jgi:phenylacetate-CoA ligase